MSNANIAAKLETIANSLSEIRLPVREAPAYSAALSAANQLYKLAEEVRKTPEPNACTEAKEETTDDAEHQPE